MIKIITTFHDGTFTATMNAEIKGEGIRIVRTAWNGKDPSSYTLTTAWSADESKWQGYKRAAKWLAANAGIIGTFKCVVDEHDNISWVLIEEEEDNSTFTVTEWEV